MEKYYTEKQREDIVHQHKTGHSTAELCEKHKIARSTLYLWVKKYSSEPMAYTPRDIYLLKKEVERL
jgi:transposase-like protein